MSAYAIPVGGLPLGLGVRRERTTTTPRVRVLPPAGANRGSDRALGRRAPQVEGMPVADGDGGATAVPSVPEVAWTPPSWEEIVREHSARVYRLAYRLTGNQHDAEDLTQEVFVRVFRSLSSYTPGTFEGWLHRITTNLFLDQARRKQRIRFDGLPEDAGDRLAGNDPGPELAWEHNNLDRDVQAALDALPPDFRAAVVLCDIEGLSYEEIAATLDVKLGTVRSRIHRGRALLRQELAHRRPGLAGADRGRAGSEAERSR